MEESYKTAWVICSGSQTSAEIGAVLGVTPYKAHDKDSPIVPSDSEGDTHPFTSFFFERRTWPHPEPSARELEEVVFEMQARKERLETLLPPFRLHFCCLVAPGQNISIPMSAELIAALASLNAAAAVTIDAPKI